MDPTLIDPALIEAGLVSADQTIPAAQSLTDRALAFIAGLADSAAELDGRVAFFLGIVTWFLVEQAIRKAAGLLRLAILFGALSAAGLSLAAILSMISASTTSVP